MRCLVVLAGIGLLMSVSAHAMPVSEFLPRADKVKAKGAMAMFSSDLKVLQSEVKSASSSYRASLDQERASGKSPSSCPPPKGKAALNVDDFLVTLRAMPPARQAGTTVAQAFKDMMTRRYPCKG